MDLISIMIFLCTLLLGIAAVTFTCLAVKFHTLEKAVIISLEDTICLLDLLEKIENMEEVGPYLAKLTKLSDEEAKIEIQKGRMLSLVARKAAEIKATLKISLPKNYTHIIKCE